MQTPIYEVYIKDITDLINYNREFLQLRFFVDDPKILKFVDSVGNQTKDQSDLSAVL